MLRLPIAHRPVAPEVTALRAIATFHAALITLLQRGQLHALRHLFDEDRRHLVTLAKPLGCRVATEHLGHLVAPETIRGWFRRLVTATPKKIKR